MKKLFISMPFNSKTEEEVMERREEVLDILKMSYGIPVEKFELIDNYHHENLPKDASSLDHLLESLKQMATADLIYFDYNWPQANGCHIEMSVAERYHLPIINYGAHERMVYDE